MTTPIYAKLAVIGCGLIGASVILAARAARITDEPISPQPITAIFA